MKLAHGLIEKRERENHHNIGYNGFIYWAALNCYVRWHRQFDQSARQVPDKDAQSQERLKATVREITAKPAGSGIPDRSTGWVTRFRAGTVQDSHPILALQAARFDRSHRPCPCGTGEQAPKPGST